MEEYECKFGQFKQALVCNLTATCIPNSRMLRREVVLYLISFILEKKAAFLGDVSHPVCLRCSKLDLAPCWRLSAEPSISMMPIPCQPACQAFLLRSRPPEQGFQLPSIHPSTHSSFLPPTDERCVQRSMVTLMRAGTAKLVISTAQTHTAPGAGCNHKERRQKRGRLEGEVE